MLVLSRKPGETIHIGNVVLKVLSSGDKVRLGFDAPLEVDIVRGELLAAREQPLAEDSPAEVQPAA